MGKSEAARLFPKRLATKGWSQNELTRRMSSDIGHVADGLVTRWIAGTREPSASQSAWLEKHLDLPAVLWGKSSRTSSKTSIAT